MSIMIIGAGPAGMACAMELAKAKKRFTLIERDKAVGGLSKTYAFKEGNLLFRTDNGPHRFFSKNPYLYAFIEDLLGERWIKVRRQTRQYIGGKFYEYPINAGQALRNIGPFKAIRIVTDYMWARIIYGIFHKPIKSFDDYIVANFGRTLGNFNMINYTEKIWGISAKTIHPDWAGQRIKGLNLITAARKALFKKTEGPKTLVDAFYYPSFGTGLIYETIKTRIEKQGNKVMLETAPVSVQHNGKRITKVTLYRDGKQQAVPVQTLVESIPITEFVRLLQPAAPKKVLQAAASLRHRSQVYLFLTIDKQSITKDQWIYFPNKEIPFGRVSEMRNFSKEMSPKGKTSLFIEFFCFEDDDIWNMPKDDLYDLTMTHLERMGLVKRAEVRNSYLIKRKNVYPVYDLVYEQHLKIIKDYLDRFENLYFIGRPGRFRYNNQDHSLEMGMLAAKSIIEGKKYDIEQVGAEQEYYEKGALYKGRKHD
jgi:protoporphyrinogen oxidase